MIQAALFTIAALATPSSAAGELTLRVQVVDTEGKPCPGLSVHIVRKVATDEPVAAAVDWLDEYLAEARTDAEQGVAVFERLDQRISPAEGF